MNRLEQLRQFIHDDPNDPFNTGTQITVRTAEADVLYLITALKDQYLVLVGEGDLNLVEQIVQRLRPISS